MEEETKRELELKQPSLFSLSDSSDYFDINRCIHLVPPFCERDIDKYFVLFERAENTLKWPRNVWSLLLQCVCTGKAQGVSLLSDLIQDYEVVKATNWCRRHISKNSTVLGRLMVRPTWNLATSKKLSLTASVAGVDGCEKFRDLMYQIELLFTTMSRKSPKCPMLLFSQMSMFSCIQMSTDEIPVIPRAE